MKEVSEGVRHQGGTHRWGRGQRGCPEGKGECVRREREEILHIDARQDGDEKADVQRKELKARELLAAAGAGWRYGMRGEKRRHGKVCRACNEGVKWERRQEGADDTVQGEERARGRNTKVGQGSTHQVVALPPRQRLRRVPFLT